MFSVICIFTGGKAPYNFVPSARMLSAKPKELKNETLPRTLSLIGSMNREILQKVLVFDPVKRNAASEFRIHLEDYVIIDGSSE